MSTLPLIGLPIIVAGQEQAQQVQEGDEAAAQPQRPIREETELRRFLLDEAQVILEPSRLTGAPPLNSSVLFPATLAPAVFPPRQHRIGNFGLSAVTTLGATYDDNIDADSSNRKDAVILGGTTSARAQSLFARHSLGFGASASGSYYVNENQNSDIAWIVGADGRIDLSRRSAISGAVSYTQGTEDPESTDIDDDEKKAPEFWYGSASLGYDRQGRRVGWGIGGRVSHTDYDDVDFDDRNQTVYSAFTNLSYRRSTRLTLRSDLEYDFTQFPDEPSGSKSRDSQRGTATVGADYDLGNRLSVGGSIGYSQVFFEDDSRGDEGSVVGDARIDWTLPGRKTSVALSVDHSIGTTTAEDASLRQTTSAQVGVVRVIGTATSLTGNLGYAHTQFNDDRASDDTIRAEARLGHAFNQTVGAGISYRYSQRFSNDPDSEFYRNIVFIGISVNL